ncbi:MAG: hypothetical protein JST85_10045 [Acidobacteria bacterium]|nr:hypothetical protein [Acidobacteriota bacterium]
MLLLFAATTCRVLSRLVRLFAATAGIFGFSAHARTTQIRSFANLLSAPVKTAEIPVRLGQSRDWIGKTDDGKRAGRRGLRVAELHKFVVGESCRMSSYPVGCRRSSFREVCRCAFP